MMEEMLVPRAQVIESRLAIRCVDEAVARALAVAGEQDRTLAAVTRERVELGLAEPPLQQQMDMLLGHYEAMLEHYGTNGGLKIARKHVAWYSKGLFGSAEFRTRINQIDDPKQVTVAIRDFYAPQIERLAA